MRYLIFGPLALVFGCVTIPIEYRYYSHPTKGMAGLPSDSQMCIQMAADKERAAGTYKMGKIDWEKRDQCLTEFGWKRMK